MPDTVTIRPFQIAIPQADLDDLQRRLDHTRWARQIPGTGWERGVPADYLKNLVSYWRHEFDWRSQEAKLNAFPQFVTEVDGQTIHFLHARSPEPNALPLFMSHGWPGSVVEFMDVGGPLTDPAAHGGDPADAFHLVAPSLPGFGFSVPLREPGWHLGRTTDAYITLMRGSATTATAHRAGISARASSAGWPASMATEWWACTSIATAARQQWSANSCPCQMVSLKRT